MILALGLEYHLNTCFKHFIFFIDEFELVEEKELAPLSELIQQFKLRKEN
jgi:MOB kinase activator 1